MEKFVSYGRREDEGRKGGEKKGSVQIAAVRQIFHAEFCPLPA